MRFHTGLAKLGKLSSIASGALVVLAIAQGMGITLEGFINSWVDEYRNIRRAVFAIVVGISVSEGVQDLIALYLLLGSASLAAHFEIAFGIRPTNLLPEPVLRWVGNQTLAIQNRVNSVLAYLLYLFFWPLVFIRLIVRNKEHQIVWSQFYNRLRGLELEWASIRSLVLPLRSSYLVMLPWILFLMLISSASAALVSYVLAVAAS